MTDCVVRRPALIVNGDDFGISREVNQGIIRAYREGILTSCSLMVTGDAFENAVSLARTHDGLAVGVHLVTVMGKSVLPHSRIPTLVDRQGNFPSDPTVAGLRYFFSARARRELERELAAQFEKFAATGLPFSHVDSHLHMHVHPVIFKYALELAEEYGVRYMRVPEDDLALAVHYLGNDTLALSAQAIVFKLLCRRMRRKLNGKGFTVPDRVYGHFLSGRMSEDYVLLVLDQLRNGLHEIYFHPGYYEGKAESLSPDKHRLMSEFRVLLSNRVRRFIETSNIQPTVPPSPGGPSTT